VCCYRKEFTVINYEVNPEKTALLVFDMVNEFCKPGFPKEDPNLRKTLVPKLKKLIECCHSKAIPVIYANHTHRRNGSDIGLMAVTVSGVKEGRSFVQGTEAVEVYDEIKPREEDIVIEKRRYSAFYGTDLDLILRGMGKDTLIVTGYSTNIGCDTTVRDANDMDYKVIFPSDGTLARDIPDVGWGPVSKEEIRKVVLSIYTRHFAMVLPIDELISKLQ
jgi:nicotinamidase-related amidase